ncbi:MAG: Lrp/AsnC family transcriptional regulator [Candidatus Nanohaloarchaeota archaeon QJJ-7]|nr:Lrp/AsnC family transcriptional regulator [Candidatus Nanohaloarchaeota archaeon QJJ-7]
MTEKTEIDDLDREILNVLLEEGRKSFRQVAEEVDSTPATVINRVERLQEEGVVTGYSADVDYRKLGYDGLAAVEVVYRGGSLDELKDQVKEYNNVVSAYTITGDTDLLLLVKFSDRDDLNRFVQEELAGSGKVDKTITHVALEVLKEGEEPPL